jgi:methylmalonyl-CoA/ethylmalonyl-CoA epimerase
MDLSSATIGQLMIPVDDFDRGMNFYKDILGLPFLFAAPPQMAFFMCGTVRLLIGVLPAGQTAQRGSAVYFKIEDIEGVASSLTAKGVNFSAQPHVVHRTPTSELWLAEFTDTDGNHLALMSEVAIAGA